MNMSRRSSDTPRCHTCLHLPTLVLDLCRDPHLRHPHLCFHDRVDASFDDVEERVVVDPPALLPHRSHHIQRTSTGGVPSALYPAVTDQEVSQQLVGAV